MVGALRCQAAACTEAECAVLVLVDLYVVQSVLAWVGRSLYALTTDLPLRQHAATGLSGCVWLIAFVSVVLYR